MEEKKLFLLDAYALIYRAYYAFIRNPRINSKGFNTSAVFGFTNTLLDVIKNEQPSHIGVVFDAPSETLRAQEYTEYKANREETPEDIRMSVPIIIDLLKAFRVPVLMSEGYEADDVIATIAIQAEKEGFDAFIMTSDKDLGQVVTDKIKIYKPASFGKPAQVLGIDEVCEKFNIKRTEQVIDVLGLMGDSVDNIPGVPGIGAKTAAKLLDEFDTLENVLENADSIKGKLGENIRNHMEQARVSKMLATIITDAPVAFEPAKLELEDPDPEGIKELFSELEFRTLIKRVLGEDSEIMATDGEQMSLFGEEKVEGAGLSEFSKFNDENVDYIITSEDDAIKEMVTKLSGAAFCFDTETTSLNAHEAELVGIAFSNAAGKAWYVPIIDEDDAQEKLSLLAPLFEQTEHLVAGQNIKYDMLVLARYGVAVKGLLFDTMVAHYLLHPEMKHGMDYLSETYLGYKPISIEELIGKKGKKQGSMRDVPLEKIAPYACEDADITFRLYEKFSKEINEGHLKKLSEEVEMPLIKVLTSMEQEGIKLNVPRMKEFSEELGKDILKLQESIHKLAGIEFNIDSPKQLGEILFDHMKIEAKVKKTRTGQYATNEEVLRSIMDKHEVIPMILDYRGLKKLKSTYVDPLPEMVNAETGRIHTTYLQTVAATGRLSSNHPNLQNIPIRTEKGREIRRAFIPRNEDFRMLSADYSQIELRIIAGLAGDETMINAFTEGMDIHASTAAKVFDVSLENVDRDMRSRAKAVNFGIIYGQTAFGLSQNLRISRTEASDIIKNYFAQFPRIQEFIEESKERARKTGYVQTILGRRRYLKDINSSNGVVRGHAERNAINAPIQGSAADIIKVAMVRIHDVLQQRKMKSRMLLQVHDELVFDAHTDELQELEVILKHEMENAVEFNVPLTVDMNAADNWLDAH